MQRDFPNILQHLVPKRILVVGDLLLDVYTSGDVERISPEAPVPVMRVTSRHFLPGGAGNVALNLIGLGNRVHLLSRVGLNDRAGQIVLDALQKEDPVSLNIDPVLRQHCFTTPEKNRLLSQSQQLMRLDDEKITALDPQLLAEIKEYLQEIDQQIDIIAVSDYGKGFVTKELMQILESFAERNQISIIVDPKSDDFSLYQGASLIKPNQVEACRAAGLSSSHPITEVAQKIFEKNPLLPNLVITQAKDGASLFSRSPFHHHHFPIAPQEVVDVTGAGDCVLSIMVFALACNLYLEQACQLANIAGRIAIRKLGCSKLSLGDVAHEILKGEKSNKILTEQGHLFALRKISESKKLVLIDATSLEPVHPLLFVSSLKQLLKQIAEKTTLLCVQKQNSPHFTAFLETLSLIEQLDFILVRETDRASNCGALRDRLTPESRYYWSEGSFMLDKKPERSEMSHQLAL